MTLVSRLKIAAALLSVTTALTSAFVWGESTGSKKPVVVPPPDIKLSGNFEVTNRFSKEPVVTYETQQGETLFALQLKAKLPEAVARPRDILMMIDTSASQAGKYLLTSREVARQVVADANVNDRVSLWVVNTPKATRNLTKQLAGAKSPAVQSAIQSLKDEYASGAVDLKASIEQGIKEFEGRTTRQQILLYVGDGESAFSKLSEKERYELAGKLRAANIQVFVIPIGGTINAQNIHSLTMGTGGVVVRVEQNDPKEREKTVAAMIERLNKAIRVPVLMPSEFKLNAEASEIYPTRLPPLRADVPVLVLGRFEKGKKPKELQGTIKGRLAGKNLEVNIAESIPAAGLEHFFLNSMISQWRDSEMKEAPALLRADRTLALAFEQGRLNRDEYLTQFNWALGVNQVDAAKNLVEAAAAIDPSNAEVKAGLKIVEMLKNGKMTIEQLKANPGVGQRVGVRFEKQADGQVVQVRAPLEQIAMQETPDAPPKANPPAAGPGAGDDAQALLKAEAARRAVEEQKVRLAVDETLYRGRERLRDADPKTAKDLIVAQRDSVRANPDISDATKAQLLNKMEALLGEISKQGETIVRAKALADEALAKARARITNINADMDREDRIRQRIRDFNSLMSQARFEEAYREALVMQQEKVNRGEPVPVETQATYQMGQAATNLREMRELTRIREDRFLLTMMQVEKSHIPYPDEPPVHFPPSRVWRDLRDSRKQYASTELGNDLPPQARRRMEFLKSALETPVSIDVEEAPLRLLLTTIEDLASPPGSDRDPARKVKILIDEPAFKADRNGEFDLERLAPIKLPGKLAGVSLSTVLRLITEQINGTFWVRRDYIEIVPASMAIREKVIRVFPVEDLVIPIPKSINVQSLGQSLAVLGASTAFAGQANMFGQIQGGFGGFGGGGGQGGNQGNQIGQFFQGNRGGQVNLGAGGGVAGFGGGQLGQFGNLGGQFGFQGGDQSTLLVRLITEVVAKGEWTNAPALLGGQAGAGGEPEGAEGETLTLTPEMLNSLGYYPPALSLVIRGTSRIHRNQSSKLKLAKPEAMNFVPGVVKADTDAIKINDAGKKRVVKFMPKKELLDKDMSADKIYQEALAKGQTVPGEIIATVDFMVQCREFKHAAELLKAGLRIGLVAEPWAQEALAMSLEASQGSSEEIERARLSGIDLEPKNPIAFLKAAKAMTAMGNPDRAIRFCKEAARIEPNLPDPYVNALAYAADSKATPDVANDLWAAQNLLGHDWMLDSAEYHLKAREHLKTLVTRFSSQNRVEEVKKIQGVIETDKRRDLVIELLWSGPADLDLKVNEAIGTNCTSLNKQTTAGGLLVCDNFSQKDDGRSETYTAAEAFNGVYRVTVDRVWGAPLAGKAMIKVTRHQGTPNQQVEIHSLELKKENSLTINFDGGRRTRVASVPPPAFTISSTNKVNRDGDVLSKLRALTSTSRGPTKMSAGAGSPTRPGMEAAVNGAENPLVEMNLQSGISSVVPNGVDLRQQTTMTKDGNVRLTMSPIFETVNSKLGKAKTELVPGGGD